MADQPKTKKGVPTRNFNDAGTGESFTEGKVHEFEVGAHANYLAAGLIADPTPAAPAKPAA